MIDLAEIKHEFEEIDSPFPVDWAMELVCLGVELIPCITSIFYGGSEYE